MAAFESEYKKLNPAQKRAVDTIDGPMLVIAGPGTGKTQLLSMRTANIIKQTDISPTNILCLTFTDNAARNMRERLETVIGQLAYHVSIHTFHSFGVEIINQYPDFFTDRQLIQQIDELGSYELLKNIFESLPHSNPLSIKVGSEYIMLRDTLAIISWLKQNAIKPAELHSLLNANYSFIKRLDPELSHAFATTPSAKYISKYIKLHKLIAAHDDGQLHYGFPSYGGECSRELMVAIEATNQNSTYAPRITQWRNKWCEKNADGKHVFKDGSRNYRKMQAVANVYESLLDSMSKKGLYDFDDMVMEAVKAIETNKELRSNLQERYQYVLVDEFQDTNKAQLRILIALGNNPIFENKPNIMAVGDDDQAIYAFQGAEVSNMKVFSKLYQSLATITLTDNYRSADKIIKASQSISAQIQDRLVKFNSTSSKNLVAKTRFADSRLEHIVLPTELAQYAWLADQTKKYIEAGVEPEQIILMAPRHRYLERLVPYLAKLNIPVAYERRENILEAPIVVQLITMARLIVAIASNSQQEVDVYLAEVLSYDFWQINSEELLNISLDCFNQHKHWLPVNLKHKNPELRAIAKWLMHLASHSSTEPLEYVLDSLLGVANDHTSNEVDEAGSNGHTRNFISPMRNYYFSKRTYNKNADTYLSLLGQLSTLRQRLRAWKPNQALYITDLVEFAQLHREAHLKIIDTNPHTQTTNAVQVMTAYKAKGLEFEVVFLINVQDEVWGPTTRKPTSRINLPKNLPIQPAGDSDNDKLRLLFVALTRAKRCLVITSYNHDLDNRLTPGLSFIGGNKSSAEVIVPNLKPTFIDKPTDAEAAEILATDWSYRFRQIIADQATLFEPILANYKLSVTHLNNFIDVAGAGPNYFFTHNLLRFPEALTPAAAFGDAVHRSLNWYHIAYKRHQRPPSINDLSEFFTDMLSRKHLRAEDFKRLNERGLVALKKYIKSKQTKWSTNDLVERGFNNEGVVIGGARLSGKIDKLHFTEAGIAEVIDFKTGKPAASWRGKDEIEKIKLYKYRQQLMFYKLLVENSATYGKKLSIKCGSLEFIEANDQAKLVNNLSLEFKADELAYLKTLITKVWQHIMTLNMPNVDTYSKSLKGILSFEDDLIKDKI